MRKKRVWIISFLLFPLLLLAWATVTTRAEDDLLKWTGLVDSRPAGVSGTWVVNGVSFVADAGTELEEEHGPLEVGTCAEVKYEESGGTNLADNIESKEPQECGGGGDLGVQVYGILVSFPAGLTGNWVVDGIIYVAGAGTEFEQEHGPFTVGECVEVKYLPDNNAAIEIETEEAYKCALAATGFSEAYGILESFPSGLVGDWIIDGNTYGADGNTQFEQEHGPFFVGGCVEVKFAASTGHAVEIETAEPDDCSDSPEDAEIKFFGLVEAIPAGNIGTWSIGGIEFVSTAGTELEEENGPFAVGGCAEVEYVSAGGVNTADEIGTEEPYHCNGGSYTNEAYGLVDSLPPALYGSWVVDGTTYVATVANTEFEQEAGPFTVGACVKVEYFTLDGINQATEIETEEPSDCAGNDLPGLSKVFATIDSFPPDPFIGTWEIGGVSYTSTALTKFEQEEGLFAINACVEAEYSAAGTVRTLHQVETEETYKCQIGTGPAPDDPEFKSYGVVESMPETADRTGTWIVSGISYEANLSTEFSENYGFFAPGAFVEVKYVVSGTTLVATEIETHVAPFAGTLIIVARLADFDEGDDWQDWVIDGTTYHADPVIEVAGGSQAPEAGAMVAINGFEIAGARFVTTVFAARDTYLATSQR